jgi:hypothetical protein
MIAGMEAARARLASGLPATLTIAQQFLDQDIEEDGPEAIRQWMATVWRLAAEDVAEGLGIVYDPYVGQAAELRDADGVNVLAPGLTTFTATGNVVPLPYQDDDKAYDIAEDARRDGHAERGER